MDTEAVYQKPTEEEISALLKEKFPEVEVRGTEARRVYTVVPKEKIFEVCTYIHDKLSFEHCTSVIGVDYVDHLAVVYLLSNYWNGCVIEISTDLPSEDPHVESVTPIWEGANWHERETWELFGIVFDNHPKLERLLTPQTYEFFPFRKSYKLRGWEQ